MKRNEYKNNDIVVDLLYNEIGILLVPEEHEEVEKLSYTFQSFFMKDLNRCVRKDVICFPNNNDKLFRVKTEFLGMPPEAYEVTLLILADNKQEAEKFASTIAKIPSYLFPGAEDARHHSIIFIKAIDTLSIKFSLLS